MKTYATLRRRLGRIAVVAAALLTAVPAVQAATGNADALLIVDCLLPGQVRKLGTRMTYVTARRPVRTAARDCEIRGGEYVALDRASYAGALNIWLPQAKAGDNEAMVRVGEIYEKGVGSQPDYQAAAQWYQQAAEKGNSRAQINLGNLYEQGLGVRQDTAEALLWYRRASGIEGELALDSGTLNQQREQIERQENQIQALRQQVDALQRELGQTRQELDDARSRLQRRTSEFDTEAARLKEARRELESRKSSAGGMDRQELARAEAEIRNREEELARRQSEIVRLSEQINRMSTEAARRESEITQVTDKDQQIKDLRQQVARYRTQLSATEKQLARARQGVAAQAREIDVQRNALEQAMAAVESARRDGSIGQKELARLQAEVDRRATALERQNEEVNKLKAEVARVQKEAESYRSKLASVKDGKSAPSQVAAAGPLIQMLDPPIPVARGAPIIKLRSGVLKRQIVGRVHAPGGLMTLIVNDRKRLPNEQGVFSDEIPITATRTPVNIAAIDMQGRRSTLDFILDSATRQTTPTLATVKEPRSAVVVPNVDFGQYHALVIGNNLHQSLPKLDTAVADAKAVADLLKQRYGFKTRVLVNATRYDILSALNELRKELTKNDNLLVYYAGHGELDEVNMRGHWLPVDAEQESTANWISNVSITDTLNVIAAKHVLVVADSCYSGALTRSALTGLRTGKTDEERLNWLKVMSRKRSRTALTSGGLKPVLDAGGGGHSVFAQAFLNVLKKNQEVLEGQRLYQEVSQRVSYAASTIRFDQTPEYAPIQHAGHEAGDFFLVPKR